MDSYRKRLDRASDDQHDELLAQLEKIRLRTAFEEEDEEFELWNKLAIKRAKQAQLQNLLAGSAIGLLFFVPLLIWLDENLGIKSAGLPNAKLFLLLVVALLGLGSALVYFYLRGWVTKVPALINEKKGSEIDSLRERVEALEIAPPPSSDGKAPSSADVAQTLLPQVSVEIAKLFEERYERKSAEHQAAVANARRFDAAVTRLEREIKEQGRKGNVNLAIGLFTTGLAIVLLISMVVMAQTPFDSIPKVAAHYLPWLSVTIFIEVFSFFFLRLYKSTLDEARRYHDDLTRLTLQWVATDTGRFSVEPTAMAALAKDLIDVSKPPKLASAESSKPAIDTDKALKALLDTLSKQLDTKTKKSVKNEATKSEEED